MEALSQGGIVYPEDDGKRLAENTAQFHWIEVLTFERAGGRLTVYRPDGQPFLAFAEVMRQKEALARQLDAANTEREQLAQKLDTAAAERDAAVARAARMAEQMRAMGLDPDAS